MDYRRERNLQQMLENKDCYPEYSNTVHEFTIPYKCTHDGIDILSLGVNST